MFEPLHIIQISYHEAPSESSLASESTISVISDWDPAEASLFTHHTTATNVEATSSDTNIETNNTSPPNVNDVDEEK